MLPGLGCLVRVLLGQAGESMQGGAGAWAPESSLATTNFTGLLTIRLSLEHNALCVLLFTFSIWGLGVSFCFILTQYILPFIRG